MKWVQRIIALVHRISLSLKEKSKFREENDWVISGMLDGVFVDPKVSYKAVKILGVAGNTADATRAGTMQVLMASTLHADYEDVIAPPLVSETLMPVHP